jgi:5-methylcytosine-specific restriction endonuclease McrA
MATRKRKLELSPLCEVCEERGVFTDAVEVHHVNAFNGIKDPLRLSMSNLQSLCTKCHNAITVERSNVAKTGNTHP